MPLLKDGRLVDDPWRTVPDAAELPSEGQVIVGLDHWRDNRENLVKRNVPLGIRLRSDEFPDEISEDLDRFAVIALEFPTFRDGRAYSHARRLRERLGFKGELRAVGNVLRDQWVFMLRCGFDAFEVEDEGAEAAWRSASGEIGVHYQPAADLRPGVVALRHRSE